MTINFPFPLIRSNSLSDSVWRGCLGVCAALQPFPWRDSAFLQGDRHLPWDVPVTKATAGGQFVVLAEMWTHGEAQGAGWEHREGWWLPRSREIQHCWLPASSLHSQITAVEQGDKARFPSLPSPLPAEPQSSCQAFFPPAPSPCSGTCMSLFQPSPQGPAALLPVTGIFHL